MHSSGGSKLARFIYNYSGDTRVYFDGVAHLFDLLVARGADAVSDVITRTESIDEESNAILLLLRHSVSLIDSAAALARLPSVEGLQIVMRSFLESKCSLEYILAEDSHRRAVAYQTKHLMDRVRFYEKMDESTEPGREFRAKWQRDAVVGSASYLSHDTKDAIDNLRSQLAEEPYKSVYDELVKGSAKHWYSFGHGPRNFEDLCGRLAYTMFYEICYRQWSSVAHSTSAYVDSFFAAEGGGYMHALRAPSGYKETVAISLRMITDFYLKVLKAINPRHYRRFLRFYKNQFHRGFDELIGRTKLEVEPSAIGRSYEQQS